MSTSSVKDFYYLNAERQPVGPMQLPAIRKLIDAGVIDSEPLVCPAGEEDWKPLNGWIEAPPQAIGPPRTPPPPRQNSIANVGATALLSSLPGWLAPVAVAVGVFSVLVTAIPLLALILAVPALIAGILLLKQSPSQKKGLGLAAVISGSLGTLPALSLIVGMMFGTPHPGGSFALFGPSIEEQVAGEWTAGADAQYAAAMFGYRVRAVFRNDGTCLISQGMDVGAAQSSDPRHTALGFGMSGKWRLASNEKKIIANIGDNAEFEMQGNNGERSFSARGGPYQSSDGEPEVWEFEIRQEGAQLQLYCYPPGFNRGYTFVRVE